MADKTKKSKAKALVKKKKVTYRTYCCYSWNNIIS